MDCMRQKIRDIYYKKILLYGLYGSYLIITSIAMVIDFYIDNRFDAIVDLVSVILVALSFLYYLKVKNLDIASILLFWIITFTIFSFIIHNKFNISIIFSLLVPMIAFILLTGKKLYINIALHFVSLGLIFIYGYIKYSTDTLLFQSEQNMSAYLIASLFVISFGVFYNIAIERSYKELKESNRQKTLLLKEIHHRVKNNLNLVSSILGIQKLDSDSLEVHKLIDENSFRIKSIALAHEMLYIKQDLSSIDFKDYVKRLTDYFKDINNDAKNLDITINMIPLNLSIEHMIQFGIMINEMMTNSIKHAFKSEVKKINISLFKIDDKYMFKFKDNGVGINIENLHKNFGMNLIDMTISQLEGELQLLNNHGLEYNILFSKDTE